MALSFATLRRVAQAKAVGRSAAKSASQVAGRGLAVGVAGAVGYHGVAKPAYTAINESIFEPYSMKNPRTVSTEGTMPGEPMLFSSAIREQYKKGMTAGQFADNGDLTLSLSNLRRG